MAKRPEEYELDTPEEYLTRCEAMIRAIYYCYRDATDKGGTDHYSLKMYVDSLIYNSIKAEEKIKAKSKNVPMEHLHVHGNSEESCRRMKESFDSYYYDMRCKAKNRIKYENR